MSKILVSLNIDFYYCELSGLFICTEDELKSLYGKTLYFGEVAGKHSEVNEKMDDSVLKIVSRDADLIEMLESTFNSETISGYNPFLYESLDDEHEDYESSDEDEEEEQE